VNILKLASDLPQLIDDYIDLEVEHIEDDKILAVILTELPDEFSLGNGD
jgi:hypothetical protein